MTGPRGDERDPLEALRDGDPGPFEAYVRRESRPLLAFFLRQGARRAEAEDLVQEVFLKLFRSAPTYEPRERFTAYTWRVARNAWIDRARRRAASPAEAEGSGGEEQGGAPIDRVAARSEEPFVGLARSEEARALRRALAELPDHHRLVFELGVLQERPYAEIAEMLDIPVGTVKSRMFNAVRRLRESVEGRGGREAAS